MKQYAFDVVIIGAGPAGVAAAGALAGTGVSVALLEAGAYAGAENWSGCVYFAESLAEPDCFGPEAVESAPFERRVMRRGTLIHNGLDEVGFSLTGADIFRHCYTVLRPVYDPYFAHLAQGKGAVLITETTVTSLIRKEGRVVGVDTNRGPLYAAVVFIAEGDASHLIRSEGMERVPNPHYLQGIKAVFSLNQEELEKRFGLNSGEGAAYEILIRNASMGGRTAKLNVGGFLYTNRDSLSLGYVLPLENVRNNYRGEHDRLFEWLRQLPYIKGFTEDATLSSYGTKIIRSGGWRERPVLVEDGLAVGGASANLGIDIPFPNFTGPAAATGLFFGRAIKTLLKQGRTLDAKNLTKEYLIPLQESVYGKNARYLSRWPNYFGKSRVLFSRTTDMICGTTHFLAQGSLADTGRFLRSHLLSPTALKELVVDTASAINSLRLWKPIVRAVFNPVVIGSWFVNLFKSNPLPDAGLSIILNVGGKKTDAASLPAPLRGLIKRISPALARALSTIYANDQKPAKQKFSEATEIMLSSLRFTDFVVFPVYGFMLFLLSMGTALWDAFRFYILKTPVKKLLREPVMAYNEAQRKIRDLDAVKPQASLEAKLATNTYRVGTTSHIRTLWPESVKEHPDMSQAGLWWVCPARVYVYDAPLLAGRGKATVNFENCIKCESCWRAAPDRALWGRFTGHALIYRPETAAMTPLIDALKISALPGQRTGIAPQAFENTLWYLSEDAKRSCRAVLNAAASFNESISRLPASADKSRRAWPQALGRRLGERLVALETVFANDGRSSWAGELAADRKDFAQKINEGRLFHALYCCRRIEGKIRSWTEKNGERAAAASESAEADTALSYIAVSSVFPDRIVKLWEEEPIPREWEDTLRTFLSDHRETPRDAVRALSSVNPALGLIAAYQFSAASALAKSGLSLPFGVVAALGDALDISESIDAVHIQGKLALVPCSAGSTLLVIAHGKGHLVPLDTPGVAVVPTPAIGFRAAGLSDVVLNCSVKKQAIVIDEAAGVPEADLYLAVALGAGDYLSLRVKEHAAGRVQFPGQMLDTEGRDGIAKLGAVKALIARVEAWRLLLETLYEKTSRSVFRDPRAATLFDLLCSTIASIAFGPDPGAMGYDAGQVFGGFAYSEDDLLSRFYRDSSLFRFLEPGHGAPKKLSAALGRGDLGHALPELGSLNSVHGEPLGLIAETLRKLEKSGSRLSPLADPVLAGEAKAIIIALRLLIVSIERALTEGQVMEAEAAAVEIVLGLAEDAVQRAELSSGRGTVSPAAVFPIEPTGRLIILDSDYESFCSAPGAPHTSGGFLNAAFDRSPRFVPEMQLHDPKLTARWTKLAVWFKENCRDKQFDGLSLERAIEKEHRIPGELIEAVKEHKWLATYVPLSEEGLGWRKAEYYILNSVAGSFGDASIDLLIMASTSIGTTPILLGLQDELPRVREELAPLADDARKLGEIGARMARIIATLAKPNPIWIKKEYATVMKLVEERIRRTRVVKYLAANFLRAFYGAGIAGRRGDFNGFISNLELAGKLFTKLIPDVRAALDELPRRERCHKLFLRYLGHGAVSAFALTEPTAGSDSGGVKTAGKLLQAKLTALEDGRYAFYLVDGDEKSVRYLIDADRIVFIDRGVAYLTPEDEAVPIKYDNYDYATDQGARSYLYHGKECLFHDIGQARKTDAGLVYEYYSLTGAKMWITNGSIATQFCFYAQTPEGVTGFMVDRHSEGLKVGADEKKTGQRGSPTNELSIDSVRVPREAVIGYEGHGQVNALETLNVGRCGLAVVSGALMRKLMQEAASALPATPERDNLLGEAAAVLFGSESLAYYLVGLFDRPHESVRMESAIAKYACSEDIHELLSLVERAFGPVGQTEKFLLEKARRDSRILTIYEGTNEVQRFLILKDLLSRAVSWLEIPAPQGDETARTLSAWKNMLRNCVTDAAALLGDFAWSDATLQPALFTLSEMAGEVLRLECIYYRIEWLSDRTALLAHGSEDYAPAMLAAGGRAAERTLARLNHLAAKYRSSWELTKNNLDMPEVRLADALLDRAAEKTTEFVNRTGELDAPVRILVIVRPAAELSPRPRVLNGEIRELLWRIDPHDLAGLSQVLSLKAASGPQVAVDVLLAGAEEHERLLRKAAGTRADALIRLDLGPYDGADALVQAVKDLEALKQYDLIVVGADSLSGDQGLGAYLAGGLKRYHYRKSRLEVKPDGTGFVHAALHSIISVTGSASEPLMDMTTMVDSLFAPVTVLKHSGKQEPSPSRFDLPGAAETATPLITDVAAAARYLEVFAASTSAVAAPEYTGSISPGNLDDTSVLWVVLEPQDKKQNLAVLRAVRHAADLTGEKAQAVVAAPRETWPSLLGLAAANGCEQAFCADSRTGRLSHDGKREMLRSLVRTSSDALIFAGIDWAGAFAYVAGENASVETTRIFFGVTGIGKTDSPGITFSLPGYEGKLLRRYAMNRGAAFVTVAPDADFPVPRPHADFKAFSLDFAVSPDWTMPLPPVTPPTLSQADVIIDVGYGIRDKAGFELAHELKRKLEARGLSPMFGATRKVTQDLKLLPLETQIGQTGVRVNPKLILALGISGAPQHIDYLGTRAEVLSFNKDAEAPLMKLNQTRPFPRVHPIEGDLFVTVRALIEKL